MSRHSLRHVCVVGLIALSLIVGLTDGVLLGRQTMAVAAATPAAVPADAQPDFRLMAEAWNLIQHDYVDRAALQPQRLTYGAISGMVDALGDTGHSVFLTPDLVRAERDMAQGHFDGIGAEVRMKDQQVVIVAPIDGSPAQQAGLRPGDIILKVNGQDTAGLPLDQVVGSILGPTGSQVTLTIQDPQSGQTRDLTLTRARIVVPSVTWAFLPGTRVAHVRIASFSQGTSAALEAALTDIQGQDPSGLILNLRNDPGGLLDEAVGVASQFLSGGNVLLEKNAQGQIQPVAVKAGVARVNLPMVALVNAGTASAAEIVGGALQDAGRAKILGETTFGTGTVLNEFSLSDGSALLLAVEEWLTPAGRTIWHKGIAPDTMVALTAEASPLTPSTERSLTAQQLKTNGDAQLLRALESLTGA